MAIYKRGNIWWVNIYNGLGKRKIRKSTGCTDYNEAKIIEQTLIAVNKGITSKEKALSILQMLLPVDDQRLEITNALGWYLNTDAREGRAITDKERKSKTAMLSAMLQWLIDNARVVYIDEVSDEMAWRYSTALGERGMKSKRRNNIIGSLRTVWEMFIRHGKAKINPWTRARALRNREEELQGRAFTDEEVERILATAQDVGYEWYGVTLTALYTGLRRRDVECLRREDIDFENRMIVITPNKTKRSGIVVHIPLHEKLYAFLSMLPPTEYLFPFRATHPNGHHAGDVSFAEILSRAGVAAGDGYMISFHSLRHTFISRLARAGVAEDVRMRLAGHNVAATHARYTHDDVSSRRAIDSI